MNSRLSALRLKLDRELDSETDHIKVSRRLLKTIGERTQISGVLKSILKDDSLIRQIASRSCEHANGFDKIGLLDSDKTYNLRLHIWWHDSSPRKREDVHNHAWDFSSIVLLGSLRTQEFQVSDTGDDKYHYMCKVTPFDPVFEFVAKTKLACVFDATLTPSSFYAQSHRVLHRAVRGDRDTTVTLVLQGPFISSESSIYADELLQTGAGGELPMKWFDPSDLTDRLRRLVALIDSAPPNRQLD